MRKLATLVGQGNAKEAALLVDGGVEDRQQLIRSQWSQVFDFTKDVRRQGPRRETERALTGVVFGLAGENGEQGAIFWNPHTPYRRLGRKPLTQKFVVFVDSFQGRL